MPLAIRSTRDISLRIHPGIRLLPLVGISFSIIIAGSRPGITRCVFPTRDGARGYECGAVHDRRDADRCELSIIKRSGVPVTLAGSPGARVSPAPF